MEHSSFVLLIFACTVGAAPGSIKTVQKVAEKLSEKRNESYLDTINFVRTKVRFALLRSAILCFRGCQNCCDSLIVVINLLNSFILVMSTGPH